MRFKSKNVKGFQVFAVSGINTISFAIKASIVAKKGLLGFAVERYDPQENERYFMYGFKVFQSVIPNPDETTRVLTFDQPIQSFVWDDFTAKPGYQYEYYFYPLRGTPRNLDRSAPSIKISVQAEILFSKKENDVFFNRGVASSQAYARKFENKKPNELPPAKKRAALQWLSRELDDALLKFIEQAKKGDTLLCCFYEFRYLPVARKIKAAIQKGVEVKLIIDGKVNEFTDSKGKLHESFPRVDNIKVVKQAKIPNHCVILREARKSNIQHNKFMVLLKGKRKLPAQVWTGSTNISDGGIHGQTNVGHWVRNPDTARSFQAYWELLAQDPGGHTGDSSSEVRKKNKAFREQVEVIFEVPLDIDNIPDGITPVFSPRLNLDVLDMYVKMVDQAETASYVTLAFGINKAFKEQLQDNTNQDHMIFMLLEKEDKPNSRSSAPFVALNASNNVYKAHGSRLPDKLYQWTQETNARLLEFNHHVSYIHSKFLLMDPLSVDPIVVSGSANFSNNSTKENDENMLIIRGNKRVADIYLTEFNRLFNHYYFRSVVEATMRTGHNNNEANLFLAEKPEQWLSKYKPGKFKQKKLDHYTSMKGFE